MRLKVIGILLFLASSRLMGEKIVTGTIQDRASRHTLSGANVYFAGTDCGTASDRFGRFLIRMSNCTADTLVVSFMGFETEKINIAHMKADTIKLHIELTRKTLILNDISVVGNRYQDELRSLNMDAGSIRMNHQEIRAVPYVLYPDVNRSLQFLPGVTSCNELTNELNVRGGSPDQNLVLLEGVPVYYPFHVFGLASAFNPDMIGEVHFSPGGFSAENGNRLGSVLELYAHSPQKSIETSMDVSLIAADVTTSGRYKKMEGIVALRKSYYDLLLNKAGKGVPYSFYDVFSRISYIPNEHHNFSLMVFTFRDRYRDSQDEKAFLYDYSQQPPDYLSYKRTYQRDYSWQNRIYSAQWDFQLPLNILSHVQIYHSSAQNNFYSQTIPHFPENIPAEFNEDRIETENEYQKRRTDVTNRFHDQSAQLKLLWRLPKMVVKSGIKYSRFYFDYGWGNSNLPNTPLYNYQDYIRLYFDYAPAYHFKYDRNIHLINFYHEFLFDFFDPLQVRVGFHSNKWSSRTKPTFEPRVSLNYNLNRTWKLKTAFGYYTQGLATALEDGVIGFLRLYFPLEDTLSLEAAHHYVGGIAYDSGHGRKLDVNVYYKNYSGLIKSIGPQPNFIQTPGRSYGLETLAQWQKNDFTIWMAFTWARSYRLINDIKQDFNWDQRIKLSTFAATGIGRRWRIAASWVIYSGVPYAMTEFITVLRRGDWNAGLLNMDRELFISQEINVPPGRIRFPWYHRLDFSLIKEFHFSKWHMETYFAMRNVYMRKNPLYYQQGGLDSEMENGKEVNFYVRHPFKWLPPIPTIGVRIVL